MKICVAQVKSYKGDVKKNISKHLELIYNTLSYNIDTIFFPELSITGYQPELVDTLHFDINDTIFNEFQNISDAHKVTIAIGVPIKDNEGIKIGMLIFEPYHDRQVYAKQILHEDEFPYFREGKQQVFIKIKDQTIAPAICYESLQLHHTINAVKEGANMYIASVAKSEDNMNKAINHYANIAQEFSIPVLLSNCIGNCGDFDGVGKSSVWNKEGVLIEQMGKDEEGVLIFDGNTCVKILQ
ncbi:carbon-nitrogen hydrolase family protein [Aquimarina algicola]|uniref:Carbon-nitrogen hydrolase family protein n=1 Tax=Aquimarina algicola TaxID=2589995 RepID=A0A504JE07_9FLAO|nr:carbon-nitrogen hydrolase family protein [Aquimarina algicola]TPN89296.1 carbon-nitrogen hydrolase family protein [Aquimarina algicola]